MTAAQQRHLFTRRWRNIVPQQSEAAFHIQLVSMLRWCIRPDVRMRHYPAGELCDPRVGAKRKAMGMMAGCADLEFDWCEIDALGRKCLRRLNLELKRRGRKLSEAQAGYRLDAMLKGEEWAIAHSIDEAIGILGERGLIRPGVEVCGRRW